MKKSKTLKPFRIKPEKPDKPGKLACPRCGAQHKELPWDCILSYHRSGLRQVTPEQMREYLKAAGFRNIY